MNRWQKIYCDTYYNGKTPRSAVGRKEFELLGPIKDQITVHFPETKKEIAKTKTFVITEIEDNIPDGMIAAKTLGPQLFSWYTKGYQVETS